MKRIVKMYEMGSSKLKSVFKERIVSFIKLFEIWDKKREEEEILNSNENLDYE